MPRIGRPVVPLDLTAEEREQLEAWVRRRSTAQALVIRARIVLLCDRGLAHQEVARRCECNPHTVGKWRTRFAEGRLRGLDDAYRSGTPRTVNDERVAEVVRVTLEQKPKDATHWSTRSLAKRLGLSQPTVSRIWRAFGLQPHRQETFKLSTDPRFVEKVRDVVGLYLAPPEKALVLCVDEKSQIQALDRSQPLLPMRPGRPQRRTHDYFRHGTTSLFAALDVKTGRVIGKCKQHHRHQELLAFLRHVEGTVRKLHPGGIDVHLVLDNYATHTHPRVKAWLLERPRWHLHFTPTGASWLNQVERFFAELTGRQLRRGVFRSVTQLRSTIRGYLRCHNADARPFNWVADADTILRRVANAAQRMQRTSDSEH